jgi:hypothetical protein
MRRVTGQETRPTANIYATIVASKTLPQPGGKLGFHKPTRVKNGPKHKSALMLHRMLADHTMQARLFVDVSEACEQSDVPTTLVVMRRSLPC